MAGAPLESFVPVPRDSDFPLNNLPFGACRLRADAAPDQPPRLVAALGDHVVDLGALQRAGLFTGPVLSKCGGVFERPSLSDFLALGRPAWREARETLGRLLSAAEGRLRDDGGLRARALLPASDVAMLLPARVGDYTDFYTSKHHAVNCGSMFRDPRQALAPNWLHLPVGYHGRASSVVASGAGVRRPYGQMLPPGGGSEASGPIEGPCQAMDFELEMAAVVGSGNELGSPIAADDANARLFGLVLLNDWSARDIQKWEMAPLGPFNGKNFCTQVSPWVVTLDALAPFRCEAEAQDPKPLPYLREADRHTWNVGLTASIAPAGRDDGAEAVVTRTNLRHLYWTFAQMAAHHTAGGCNLAPGDLLGSGTVSGPGEGERGCLFEATWGGTKPLALRSSSGGSESLGERVYLVDGDEVVLRGRAEVTADGGALPGVGFGECRGRLLPCGYGASK